MVLWKPHALNVTMMSNMTSLL